MKWIHPPLDTVAVDAAREAGTAEIHDHLLAADHAHVHTQTHAHDRDHGHRHRHTHHVHVHAHTHVRILVIGIKTGKTKRGAAEAEAEAEAAGAEGVSPNGTATACVHPESAHTAAALRVMPLHTATGAEAAVLTSSTLGMTPTIIPKVSCQIPKTRLR